jgi:hypothetical protein
MGDGSQTDIGRIDGLEAGPKFLRFPADQRLTIRLDEFCEAFPGSDFPSRRDRRQ